MAVQAPRFTFHWQMASWSQVRTPLDPVAQFYQLLLPLEIDPAAMINLDDADFFLRFPRPSYA